LLILAPPLSYLVPQGFRAQTHAVCTTILTFSFYTKYVYGFRTTFRINSNCFLEHH
jgi:hypothetical protein